MPKLSPDRTELEFEHKKQWKPFDRHDVGNNVEDAWKDILFERYLIKINRLKLMRLQAGLYVSKAYWNRTDYSLLLPDFFKNADVYSIKESEGYLRNQQSAELVEELVSA